MVEEIKSDVKEKDLSVPEAGDNAQHQELLSAEQLQEKITQLEEINSNLNKALKEERGQGKAEREKLTENLSLVSQQLEALRQAQSGGSQEDIDLEALEYVDGKTFKKYLQIIDRKTTQYIKEIQDREIINRMNESETRAIEKYKDMPEGLDYSSVFNKFVELLKENPGYGEVLKKSSNPAETAYRIGLTHPDLELKKDELNKQKLLGNIDKTKATTLKAGGGKTSVSIDQYSMQDLIEIGMKNPAMLEKLAKER